MRESQNLAARIDSLVALENATGKRTEITKDIERLRQCRKEALLKEAKDGSSGN